MMRLPEVERGDSIRSRGLITAISAVSRIRLPDAARVAFYHKRFVSRAFGQWTQATMRGPSEWTVGERELMGAMVATWNSSPFCIGAHRAVAIRGAEASTVDACLADYRSAPISEPLRAALSFMEMMTLAPEQLGSAHARAALAAGVSHAQLVDAAAVAALFNSIARYSDALGFEVPTDAEFDTAAGMLLKRGYA